MIGWLGGLQSSRQPNSCAAKREPLPGVEAFPGMMGVWWVAACWPGHEGCVPPARVRGLRQQETRSLLLQPLLSLLARQKARVLVGCGAGAGSRLPGKKRPDPSRCQSLAGQRGQAPVFSWAGAGRPAKTRGRAAAGHIPSPSPPHCRESYSASGNQEIMECCLLCVKLGIVTRVPPLCSLAMEVWPLPLVPGCSVAYPGPGPGSALQIVSTDWDRNAHK